MRRGFRLGMSCMIVVACGVACGRTDVDDGTAGSDETASGGSSEQGTDQLGGAGVGGGHSEGVSGGKRTFFGVGGGLNVGAFGGDLQAPGPEIIGEKPEPLAERIDVLFVVDNSMGMKPHQQVLQDAAVNFIDQLAHPPCVGAPSGTVANDEGMCPGDAQPAYHPPTDVHFGVVSSSVEFSAADGQTDNGHLLPTLREGVPDPTGEGFLQYTGDTAALPSLKHDLQQQIESAGDEGYGFESPLEAAFRFLVEPEPPQHLVNSNFQVMHEGLDTTLLDQRRAFLRDDSALVIIVLTDENDCSAMNGGGGYEHSAYGWLTSRNEWIAQPREECDEDPNDPCCASCMEATPTGCEASPRCTAPPQAKWEEDRLNVRCFDQKRRFGMDLLFPTQRYIDAFSQPILEQGADSSPIANPLFIDDEGRWKRAPEQVFFAAIVGVPWQDLATETSLEPGTGLSYRSSSQMKTQNVEVGGELVSRWDLLLGDAEAGVPPFDPFMVGSIGSREGTHPLVEASLSSQWNEINGHELDNTVLHIDGAPAMDEIQDACITALPAPIDCEEEDCVCARKPSKDLAICQDGPDSEQETTQFFASADPGTRLLEVTRALGESGVPASICPKILDPEHPDFGYRPAMTSLLSRLGRVLSAADD